MANKALIGILGFITGGLFGWFLAAKVIQDKYDAIVQEEIDSVKKAFHKSTSFDKVDTELKEVVDEVKEYEKQLEASGYTEDAGRREKDKPYQINPEQFGDNGYDMLTFTYYADSTLTDDMNHPMAETDISDAIGSASEFLKDLGEDGEDAIYIRNDRVKVDYEIVFDPRTYGEVLRERPYLSQNT